MASEEMVVKLNYTAAEINKALKIVFDEIPELKKQIKQLSDKIKEMDAE